MSEEVDRPPWWLSGSGDESADGSESAGSDSDSAGTGFAGGPFGGGSFAAGDLWSMVSMVGNVAGEWLASSGAREHAAHADPLDHPECLVCKALVGLNSVTADPAPAQELPPPVWLTLRRA